MEEYFTQEIIRLKNELTNLKTAAQKSASAVPITSQTVNIEIPLSYSPPVSASGRIKYAVLPDGDAIIVATLEKLCDDPTQAHEYPKFIRQFDLSQDKLNDSTYILYIYGEGDQNDVDTLSGGGSVVLTNRLTVRATAPFTLEKIS